ncbi:diacylglycerol kinase family lipid kinase [Rhodococcus sp. D2-41]|uniref:Diacylglycerol kinase family lipid kinase n=1 Tax=Speluncibacter jeojiensis TaxID=2710754 RepID=A0A9X4M0S6_9ACTN|nr:diacylglycerol kinase family protein [Rhodococcus sp. D2-41]MDG3008768.1 diacylglycerol kinase family lipid kinase [Rhodococcus sp. D2-41]MDG3013023.1 diacylglycerol kinase family lipid kinase [Corynebacteriales bacterium D3-21]
MRALLIVNPNATSTTPAGRDLLAHALASRLRLKVVHTTHRGHAGELARQAATDGASLIVVHGGDGTVNEVVNGLLGPPKPASMQSVPIGPIPAIAVVPGGSANVFARSLGIHADPVEATNQLLDLLAAKERRRIGLAHCDNRWFTFNAGMGLDAMVVEAIEAARHAGRTATPARYVRTAVRTFFRTSRRAPTLSVRLPGRPPIEGVHYAFVSNASPWTYLNQRPVHTNPETGYDTGLGLFAMRSMGVFTSLRLSRQLLAPGAQPKVGALTRIDDVSNLTIHSSEPIGLQLDGDYIGQRTEVHFASVPSALDVVAPPAP